jgi:hypothetical protein
VNKDPIKNLRIRPLVLNQIFWDWESWIDADGNVGSLLEPGLLSALRQLVKEGVYGHLRRITRITLPLGITLADARLGRVPAGYQHLYEQMNPVDISVEYRCELWRLAELRMKAKDEQGLPRSKSLAAIIEYLEDRVTRSARINNRQSVSEDDMYSIQQEILNAIVTDLIRQDETTTPPPHVSLAHSTNTDPAKCRPRDCPLITSQTRSSATRGR